MKKTIIHLLILALLPMAGLAQGNNKAYIKAMKTNIQYVDTTWGYDNYKKAAEKFAFIGAKKPGDWLPLYYHAYCLTYMSVMIKNADRIDSLTAVADRDLKIADSLSKNNAEIYALKSLNVVNKINADYINRGLSYSKIANDILDQAMKLDSTNPRVHYLRGLYLMYRPKAFGGGKEPALPNFTRALYYYQNGKPPKEIHPSWGRKDTQEFIDKCKK